MIDPIASGLSFLPLQFSRNLITYTIPAATESLSDRSDLRYLLQVKKPTYTGSTAFETLRVLEGREKPPYTVQGTTVYEGARFPFNRGRGGMIDGLMDYTKPIKNQNNLRAVLTQTFPYQLIEQILGGTPIQNSTNTIAPKYAIKAGLATEDFAIHGETYWTDFQAANRKFLTWQPDFKRVAMEQEEYLHFLLNFSPIPTELRLRVQFYNYGSEATVATTAMTLSSAPQYAVVSVPVGASVLGMDSDYDFYQVWLSDQNNNRLSEVRTYQLDKNYEAFDRGLLFVNSMGGWDTLRCRGRANRQLNVNQAVAQRERLATNDVEYSDLLLINTEGNRSVTVSTGFFHRDSESHLRWLSELLLTESCYWMTDKGHLPVQIVTNNLVDAEDDSDMVARIITFKLRDTVENFSSMPAGLTPPARPTIWIGANASYAVDAFGKRTGWVSFQTLRKAYSNNSELVQPFEFKPNAPGDPDYIPSTLNGAVTVGSTPYPNTEIRRLGTYTRNTCGGGGTAAEIVVPAGKYGGEISGAAQILAEAEYTALNTQDYANTYGTCLFQSAAISRLSTYAPNTCTGGKAGIKWTITVAAGAYTSAVSQADADAQANAYANSMDTQANANINGTCGWGNTAVSRTSNYARNSCTGGMVGTKWTISVAANTFVSAVSQADANAQATADMDARDTQANANLYGTCRYESACTSKTSSYLIQSGANVGRPLTVWYSKAVCTSLVSQADADAQVNTHFNANYNSQSVVNTYAALSREDTDYCSWNMSGQITIQVRN